MTDHDDLDWLAIHRPAQLAPGAATTARSRAALLEHMTARQDPLAIVRPAAPTRRAPERRWLRPSRVLAVTAVAAAVAVAAVTTGGGGGAGVVGADKAVAAPLVRLSNAVRTTTALPGDATLIVRHHTFADGTTMEGADLYLDDGTYYFSQDPAGLPAVVAAHETTGDGWAKRITDAAVAALHLDVGEARTRMANAAYDPAHPPTATPPASADDAATRAAIKAKLGAARAANYKPLTPLQHENGMIWSNSLDAIVAGGSRPDVRAGVLRLLATIPDVAVSQTTVAGKPALELDASVFSDGYEEHLAIDAETGLPLRFVGGYPGKTPGVVMTYDVSRVTAADIARKA